MINFNQPLQLLQSLEPQSARAEEARRAAAELLLEARRNHLAAKAASRAVTARMADSVREIHARHCRLHVHWDTKEVCIAAVIAASEVETPELADNPSWRDVLLVATLYHPKPREWRSDRYAARTLQDIATSCGLRHDLIPLLQFVIANSQGIVKLPELPSRQRLQLYEHSAFPILLAYGEAQSRAFGSPSHVELARAESADLAAFRIVVERDISISDMVRQATRELKLDMRRTAAMIAAAKARFAGSVPSYRGEIIPFVAGLR